ncbi:MAG: alpha/beta fold hydrolase [Pseudorhodoplanes sp.]
MSQSGAAVMKWYAQMLTGASQDRAILPEPQWTTPNRIRLELPSMHLREFSTGSDGIPALVCAPYALHGATIADFGSGHSIVEALLKTGVSRIALTDWRSCAPEMRYFSIDTYLADLNVAVDALEPPVDLIGLCQGGWMALVYAARFPNKVRRLVLAGAPVDIRAAPSKVSRMSEELPLAAFESLVQVGGGRVLGDHAVKLWGTNASTHDPNAVMQLAAGSDDARQAEMKQRFAAWDAWTLDLPGTYYLEVVRYLFKENRIAEGTFPALGEIADLSKVRAPLYLLAGADDDVAPPEQVFAAAGLVATPGALIERQTVPCGHLSLFLGRETISQAWVNAARWLMRAEENVQQGRHSEPRD